MASKKYQHAERFKRGFASKRLTVTHNYFGETLREIRSKLGISQIEAARKIGMTQGQWSAYETGETSPTIDFVLLVAITFDLDSYEIVTTALDKAYSRDKVQDRFNETIDSEKPGQSLIAQFSIPG